MCWIGMKRENPLVTKRKEANKTQQGLAYQAKISIKSIHDYEQGRRKLSNAKAITVKKLADVLNCSMEELIGESLPTESLLKQIEDLKRELNIKNTECERLERENNLLKEKLKIMHAIQHNHFF